MLTKTSSIPATVNAMPIDPARMMDLLRRHASFQDESAARRTFDATLRALRRGLDDDEADWLALDLGPELAAPLLQESYVRELSPEELYRWTGRFAGLRRGVARQQVQVVCRALSQLLSPATLARLHAGLPELAPLFRDPTPEDPPPEPYPRQGDARP